MNKLRWKAVSKWLLRALYVIFSLILLSAAVQRIQGKPVPTVLGWGAAVVQTGSMEPAIPTGSLIIIQNTGDYKVGNIVTYLDKRDIAVTHRIIAVNGDMITTQGDANNAKDRPFGADRVIGKVQHILPGIGRGLVPILITASIILTAALAGDILTKRKEQPENA